MASVDYIKFKAENVNLDYLINDSGLDFKAELSKTTGEISIKQVANFHYCKVTVYEKTQMLIFSGSIHKLWNSLNGLDAPNREKQRIYKGYNGNDFGLDAIEEVVKYLCGLLKCSAQRMIVQKIEFGLNVQLPFKASLFLKGLLFQNGVMFEHKHNERYWQVRHSKYILKIYDKANQYGMYGEVLRFEIKAQASQIKMTEIKTLEDITSTTLNIAFKLLLMRFEEVVYYDYTIAVKSLKRLQRNKLKEYSNPRYWINELRPEHRNRPKKKLNEIIVNHSENLKEVIKGELLKKCVIISRPPKEPKCVIISPSSIGDNITHLSLRKCPITGVDISIQKSKSRKLTKVGLKHLYRTDKATYSKLSKTILGLHYNNLNTNEQISTIDHQINHRYRKLIREYPKMYLTPAS